MQASGFQQDAQGWFIVTAPTDDRDYSLDWTNVLASASTPADTIATSSWSVPTPLVAGAASKVGNVTTTFITAPAASQNEYFIANTITTTGGREFTRGFRLIVAENI